MNAQQLKNSILQLAVQGKLVPQDPNDEPASVLVERIRAEKERLIKEKKIKKDKNPSYIFKGSDNLPYEKLGNNEPICIAEEVPFEIPDSWEWVRLKNLVNYSMGKTPPRKEFEYWENAIYPWVSIADLNADKYIDKTKECVGEYAFINTFKNRIVPKGTLLMSFKLTVGKVSILNIDAVHNEAIISIFPYIDTQKITTLFLFKTLPLLSQNGNTKTAIKGNTLNSDSLGALLIPLPPLAEQERIVNKIKELEPYIKDYDIAYEKIEKLNKDFPEQLKKSILQDAVQGKLVPQDENDEPASVLMEKIRQEKAQLIKVKKIKKDKNESYIFRRDNSHYEKIGDNEPICIDSEIPFDIPDSWEWARLGSICTKLVDGDHNPPKGEPTKTNFIMVSSTNINNNMIVDIEKVRYLSKENFDRENQRTNAQIGDIFFTSVGSIGRSCVYQGGLNICFQRSVSVLKTLIYNYYLKYCFDSLYFQQKVNKEATGTAQKGFYLNQLSKSLIPIPPLEEQKRIVEKVEQLLPQIKTLQK